VSPTHQDLSNDTPFSQIKSRVHVPLNNRSTLFLIDCCIKGYSNGLEFEKIRMLQVILENTMLNLFIFRPFNFLTLKN